MSTMVSTSSATPIDRAEAARAALAQRHFWYHTIELAPGISTPGATDCNRMANKALPASFAGKRCLDVGTFDGFWAFQMEDRGAASVVAIDVDDMTAVDHPPLRRATNIEEFTTSGSLPGTGFRLAAEVRQSDVRRVGMNVYDLTPEAIGGQVDFVLVGAILQHLRDPVRALERIRDCLVPGGEAVIIETISTRLTLTHPKLPVGEFRAAMPHNKFTWWVANLALVRSWPRAAGLRPISRRPIINKPTSKLVGRGDLVTAVRVRKD